jgi:hypothetical protein
MRYLVEMTIHTMTEKVGICYGSFHFHSRFGSDTRSSRAHSFRGYSSRDDDDRLSLGFNIDNVQKRRMTSRFVAPFITAEILSVCLYVCPSVRDRKVAHQDQDNADFSLFAWRSMTTVLQKVRLLASVATVIPRSSESWPTAKWSPVAGTVAVTLQLP